MALFAGFQGLGSEVVSTIACAAAVKTLGTRPPTAAGALTPAIVAAFSTITLGGTPLTFGAALGIVIVAVGGLIHLIPHRQPHPNCT